MSPPAPPQQTQAPPPQTPAAPTQPAQTPAAPTQPPSTGPTAAPAPSQPAPAAPAPPPPSTPAHHARITYLDHQLTIAADNSSLNQILNEVSQLTGITITGGVAEERVFGSYGPASPSHVLDQLLDGTASNMILLSSAEGKPAQLILTPRGGGPTPPSPGSMQFNEHADSDDPPLNPPEPPSESSSVAAPEPAPATPAATPPASPSGTPQNPASASDPNGAKTPQQIYDQLMQLRQQQQSK
jgi:hypothetical protein